MPYIAYTPRNFRTNARRIIQLADEILSQFAAEGYEVTLRQLYYQFVARDLIPNSDRSYKQLGETISNARMAGMIDWHHLIDRGRYLRSVSTWDDPSAIIDSAAAGFRTDLWDTQENYVEVWIEKDALVGVIERPCNKHRVPHFSCRGYTSSSSMWGAAQRIGSMLDRGKDVTILHMGDHDPSGIDMTRDIRDRLTEFLWGDGCDADRFTVDRIALTMAQVREFSPPPNPAKLSDARARGYIERYGRSSWELDALSPTTLGGLIEDGVNDLLDAKAWKAAKAIEDEHRRKLAVVVERWDEITEGL